MASFNAFHARRVSAWNHLVDLLGDVALGSAGSKSNPVPGPTTSGRNGKGKNNSNSGLDGAGGANAMEGLED